MFWFNTGALRAARVSWTNGLTSTAYLLKQDLCSGEKFVELSLIGTSQLSGATVLLDAQRLGVLSSTGDFNTDVPLGIHELRVEKEGCDPWSATLRYDESSSGYDRVSIPALQSTE